MGVWNSHTSVGNILGSLIAGYWVSTCWGLSFIVPGAIVAAMGIVCFLFLIERKCLGVAWEMTPGRASGASCSENRSPPPYLFLSGSRGIFCSFPISGVTNVEMPSAPPSCPTASGMRGCPCVRESHDFLKPATLLTSKGLAPGPCGGTCSPQSCSHQLK